MKQVKIELTTHKEIKCVEITPYDDNKHVMLNGFQEQAIFRTNSLAVCYQILYCLAEIGFNDAELLEAEKELKEKFKIFTKEQK